MRTAHIWLIPITGLLMLGCDQGSAPTAPADQMSADVQPGHVTRFDGSHTFVGCNGDLILVENHELVVTSFRGTPELAHIQFHVIEINSTATDLTTGAVQTFHGADNEELNGDITGDTTPGELTVVIHQTFTSPGTQASHLALMQHITINQNGVVTVDKEVGFAEGCS